MSQLAYNGIKKTLMSAGINLATDTIKGMLLTNAYAPNIDTDVFASDINSHEVSGTGYTAGGKAITTQALTLDLTNDCCYLDADDLVWANSTITARVLALYKDTGNQSTSPLIGYIIFVDGSNNPADKSTNGDSFYVQWALPASGAILYLS